MFDQSRQPESSSDSGARTAGDQFFLNATLGLNHWWRWIVGVVVILIMWIGVGSIGLGLAGCELLNATNVLGLGCSGGEFTGNGGLSAQIVIFGSGFAVGLLGIWLVLKYIHRKRFMGLLTGRANLDCSRFLVGMLAALVALLVLFAVDIYVFQWDTTFQKPGWEFVVFVLVAAAFVPIQSGYEEAFFRGYILHGLINLSRNRVVLAIVTGIIFALPHLGNPEPGEHGLVPYLGAIVTSGIFFAVVVLLDGGLELAWGYHFINNFFLGVVANTDVSPIATPSLYIVHADNFELFPHVFTDVVAFALVVLALNVKYSWFRLRPR